MFRAPFGSLNYTSAKYRYSGEFIESRSLQQTAPAKLGGKPSICINRYNNGMNLLDVPNVAIKACEYVNLHKCKEESNGQMDKVDGYVAPE
jgi:hypothetical protein